MGLGLVVADSRLPIVECLSNEGTSAGSTLCADRSVLGVSAVFLSKAVFLSITAETQSALRSRREKLQVHQ